MKLKRTGKLLALLLAVVMVVSLLPTVALADDTPFEVRLTADGTVIPVEQVEGWYSDDYDQYKVTINSAVDSVYLNVTGNYFVLIGNPAETISPITAGTTPTLFPLTEDFAFDASAWIDGIDTGKYDYYGFYLLNEDLDDYVMVVLEVAKAGASGGAPFEVRLTADGAVIPAAQVEGWYSDDYDQYKVTINSAVDSVYLNVTGNYFVLIGNPAETISPITAGTTPTLFPLTEDFAFDASAWIDGIDTGKYDYYGFYLLNEDLDDYVMVVLEVAKAGGSTVVDDVIFGDLYLVRIGDATIATRENVAVPSASDFVWEGQRAAIVLCREYNVENSDGTVAYRFYAGEDASGEPIASFDNTGYWKGSNRATRVLIDPLPMLEKITATVQLDGGEVFSKTFDVSVLASGETAMEWLDAPDSTESYPSEETAGIRGPNVYDVAAFADESTGELNLYLAVSGGIMQYSTTDSTSLVWMEGIQHGYNDNEYASGHGVAVGGPDKEHLAALIKNEWSDTYCVAVYDGSAWSAVEDSEVSGTNLSAVVMSAEDIWTYQKHWDGSGWTANETEFNSFWKADAKTAYAGSEDGIFKYAAGEWTKVSGTSGTMYVCSGRRTENGATLIASTYYVIERASQWHDMWSRYGSTIYRVEITGTEAVANELDVSSLISTNATTNHLYVGISSDGTLYAITNGRAYYVSDFSGYTGSYLYRYEDGAWVYQEVDEFNNEADAAVLEAGGILGTKEHLKQRPDGIRHIENPIDGVTIFAGQGGGNYVVFGTSTITFITNGGSKVEPITQTIGSAVTPPTSPTREGYTFMGWYTMDNLMTNGPSYTWGVMPAKNLTLYAKWSEVSGGGTTSDPFATEREKAQASLDTALSRLTQSDYDASVWSEIQSAYNNGAAGIAAAATYDEIYAALNAAVDEINELAKNTSGVITVAVTVEKFTVDGTYIIEPTLVECAKYERASVVVTDLLKDYFADAMPIDGGYNGNPYRLGPNCTETDSFYLAGVWDGNTMLSEFDGGQQSGWMYCVNGSFPGVGASAWTLKNGDVMRWQYTCEGLGADIGSDNSAWGDNSSVTVADKDALIWKIAEINDAGTKADFGDAYDEAMTVLKTITATQAEVDAALAALNGSDSGGSTGGGSGSGTTDENKDKDENPTVFEDVPEDAYYAEAVAWAVENGITDGVTETEFKPESTCNRGQIVTFLWRAAGSPKPTSTNNPFEDVKETDYFYEAVLWAVANGVTDGVDATHFAPGRPCTREQAVTFLWRAAGSENVSGGEPFADVDAGDYSAAAVAWAVANEITDGVSETRFAPENECTRGQIVTFLYREYGEQ